MDFAAGRIEYDHVAVLGLVVEGNAGLEEQLAADHLERCGIGAGKGDRVFSGLIRFGWHQFIKAH